MREKTAHDEVPLLFILTFSSTMCGPSRRNGSRFSARSRRPISFSTSLTGSTAAGSSSGDGFTVLNLSSIDHL